METCVYCARRSKRIGGALILLLLIAVLPGVTPAESVAFPDGASTDRSWRNWGGPAGDFKLDVDGLAETWPEQGPKEIWNRPLGIGYSAIAADRGALFTMYREDDEEIVAALRADDGRTIWTHRYSAPAREGNVKQFGLGPHATPLVLDDRVITLGYTGLLHCLSLKSGKLLWSADLVEDLGAEVLNFGNSASPVLHDGRVIVLAGGKQGAVALDPKDGSVKWSSPAGTVSYATPIVIDVDGQQQIVYFAADEVVGIDASNGKRLWSHPCVNQYQNNSTAPIWGGDNMLWVATQMDGGTRMLHLSRDGAATQVKQVWSNDKIKIHFWNAVRLGDHIYAAIGSGSTKFLACIEARTGKILWRERGYDLVNLIHAGERTILLDGHGKLELVDLSPEGVHVRSRVELIDGDAWTVPTLVGTTLYVRDKQNIRALSLAR